MPELPEVENTRRALTPTLIGATITSATLHRRDIACAPGDPPGGWSRSPSNQPPQPITKPLLLVGNTIQRIDRVGKRLAIVSEHGSVAAHLGMTGQLLIIPPRQRPPKPDHIHATWHLQRNGAPAGRLIYRDPRRFGGIWLLPAGNPFDHLGPDALTLTTTQLAHALANRHRPVKALLLDQARIAGIGNIYADEALHRARIHPQMPASALTTPQITSLAQALRTILARAIDAGGSTIRDYNSAPNTPGAFQSQHLVYGRASLPCRTCSTPLATATIAQRTTVWCPTCQPQP